MEEYNEIIETEELELQLNHSAKEFLKETAKWTYFLSILGYIGVGFIVLAAFFASVFFSFIGNLRPEMHNVGWVGGSFLTTIYLIIAALYFFPIYYLNKFSSKLKTALRTNDSEILADSFEYLKSHYKYIGIFAVVILSFYALILLGFFIVALTVGMN